MKPRLNKIRFLPCQAMQQNSSANKLITIFLKRFTQQYDIKTVLLPT